MTGHIVWQILGWLALALNVAGNLAVVHEQRPGRRDYAVRNPACVALFAAINVYGYRKWRQAHTEGKDRN